MAAFATPAELASWLQVPSVDTATATLALNVASAAIRGQAGWSITQEVVTAAVVDGPGGVTIWLATPRLTAVALVKEEGVTLTVVTDYDWKADGRLVRVGGVWSCKPRAIELTYTHGYSTVPDDIKGLCLQVAGRLYHNPDTLRSYTVGGVSETFAGAVGELGLPLNLTEMELLSPYRVHAFA